MNELRSRGHVIRGARDCAGSITACVMSRSDIRRAAGGRSWMQRKEHNAAGQETRQLVSLFIHE